MQSFASDFVQILVPSANVRMLFTIHAVRSFTYTRNRTGPITGLFLLKLTVLY